MIKELATGQTGNKHVLEGNFKEVKKSDDVILSVENTSLLKHVDSSGKFAEHNTLIVEPGNWVVEIQVEYNPFQNSVGNIWD